MRRLTFAAGLLGVSTLSLAALAQSAPQPEAVPPAQCGPGSRPETDLQGRVTETAELPTTCNAELVSHFGASGGLKVERYVDAAGHECAYFDSTLLFPLNVPAGSLGTYVLDMSDPANPVNTATLRTPAMVTPHESLLVNHERGLLGAVMGNPLVYPGVIDLYDLSGDCRSPVFASTSPTGVLGHESGWTRDGNTFYAASIVTGHLTAVDVSDPASPRTLWTGEYASHGLSLNADGTRAYLAARTGAGPTGNDSGLVILDVSEIQDRVLDPQVRVVGTLTWPDVSIPQNAMPITIGGHPYLLEIDEFAGRPAPSGDPDAPVGSARIIDISNERSPFVVSTIKLEVHLAHNRPQLEDDPVIPIIGYTGHYCNVPREVDPVIAACTMVASGLRVFDIRDPANPREVAYFNTGGTALARPAFVPERDEIWYADGGSGFYAVRITNGAWPDGPAPAAVAAPPAPAESGGGTLARTGAVVPVGALLAVAALGILVRAVRR